MTETVNGAPCVPPETMMPDPEFPSMTLLSISIALPASMRMAVRSFEAKSEPVMRRLVDPEWMPIRLP